MLRLQCKTMAISSAALSPQNLLNSEDTIVALSSAAGAGARAILRLTGPRAWAILRSCFDTNPPLPDAIQRGRWSGSIALAEFSSPLSCQVLAWQAPRTYTGQDLVEVHTSSSPPLVEVLLAALLRSGARAAQPGEFTLRAFLAGKLDLTQAEAVLGVIEAEDPDQLRTALGQLAGGIARPLQALRDDLLHLLAEVEAGLDFTEEDLSFISSAELERRLQGTRHA